MNDIQCLSHTKWECSCRVDSEIPAENTLRSTSEEFGGSIARTCPSERMQDSGRASAAGSYPHANFDIFEIFSSPGGRIHKRQECDPYSSDLSRVTEELQRHALLGTRLFCFNSRSG